MFINCTLYVSINFLPLKLLIPSLLASKMSGERKAVIKNADMAEDMQQDAVECATQVLYYTIVGRECHNVTSPIPHFTSPSLVKQKPDEQKWTLDHQIVAESFRIASFYPW